MSDQIDAILIDDDELVHMTWNLVARKLNKNMRAFKSVEEFKSIESSIHKSTPIYIDHNLGPNIDGSNESKILHGLGFTTIYLCTGHPPEYFKNPMPWLKGIVGKSPPWT